MADDRVEKYYRTQYETFYAEYDDEYQASHRGLGTDDRDIEEIFLDVSEKLRFSPDDVVLDLGSGSGLLARKVLPKVKKIYCFDGSKSAIDKFRTSLPAVQLADCYVGNFTDPLPYPDATFSKILSYSVFHFLGSSHDFLKVLRELDRIIKPGGLILLGDLDVSDDLHRSVRAYFMQNWFPFSLRLLMRGKVRLAAKVAYKRSIILGNDSRKYKILGMPSRILKYFCKSLCILTLWLTERKDTMKTKKKHEMKRKIQEKIGEIDKIPHFQYSAGVFSLIDIPEIRYKTLFQRPSLPYAEDRLDLLIEKASPEKQS